LTRTPVTLDANDRALLIQVIQYYRGTLKRRPWRWSTCKRAALRTPELIEHFKRDFANRAIGLRLADKRRVNASRPERTGRRWR
jgi:hypothetical protein